jgi:hypothetical protein
MRFLKRYNAYFVPIILTLIPASIPTGCGPAKDETAVYKETYIGVCEDLDVAAVDMEAVIRGAAGPSPDWEALEGNAESVYKTFSSCAARMGSVKVPAEYATGHEEFAKALSDGCTAAAAVLEAVRARDREAIDEAAADFEKAGRRARAATEIIAAIDEK